MFGWTTVGGMSEHREPTTAEQDEVAARQVEDSQLRRSEEESGSPNPDLPDDKSGGKVSKEAAESFKTWEKDAQSGDRPA